MECTERQSPCRREADENPNIRGLEETERRHIEKPATKEDDPEQVKVGGLYLASQEVQLESEVLGNR